MSVLSTLRTLRDWYQGYKDLRESWRRARARFRADDADACDG